VVKRVKLGPRPFLPEEDSVLEEYILRENCKGNFPTRDAFLKIATDLIRRCQTTFGRADQKLGQTLVEQQTWGYLNAKDSHNSEGATERLYQRNCEHYFKSLEETLNEVHEE
jgi:hypothetical protein